jgi:hypothetical protein
LRRKVGSSPQDIMPKRTKAQGNISMVFVAIDAAIAAAIAVIWLPDLPDPGTISPAFRPACCNANAKAKMPLVGRGLSGRVPSCGLSTDKK